MADASSNPTDPLPAEGSPNEENALDPFGGFALDALFDETDNIDVVVLDS